eukprot:scaffold130188_cov28-Tisochrysis_lutea.AAC.4
MVPAKRPSCESPTSQMGNRQRQVLERAGIEMFTTRMSPSTEGRQRRRAASDYDERQTQHGRPRGRAHWSSV